MVNKKTYLAIALIVSLIALVGFAFYSYLTPDISINIMKPADSNSESYYEQVSVSVSEKFGLPLPKNTSNNLNDWTLQTSAVMQEIASLEKPFEIKTTVEIIDGKTIVLFEGIHAGNEDYYRQLEFDFVLTEEIY